VATQLTPNSDVGALSGSLSMAESSDCGDVTPACDTSCVTDTPDAILDALWQLTGNTEVTFHDGQREAIEALVYDRARLLLVQRTGWGKSAVYFVATHLLRKEGLGPTLLISPLLVLMRNQIAAAERLGLRTFTINSDSDATVDELLSLIDSDEVDLLVVSPERLANPEFANKVMPVIGRRPGLTVVDEVHCISDWGHDFRPDYRRIGNMLSSFPEGLPILGCTATANQRVVQDAREQLGHSSVVQRGPLARAGLSLGSLELSQQSDRLAWMAENLSNLPGSGIVYCLTIRDVEIVAAWLQSEGLDARPYHANLTVDWKLESERMLLDGSLKILVATTALGMGYDNPAIGFVVHYQSPGSVVHYYQQVGRAGRALSNSKGVLLRGAEDDGIVSWFIDSAFPSEEEIQTVLRVLNAAEGPLSIYAIEAHVNLKHGVLENVLKQLDVAGAIRRVRGQTYERTLATWEYPKEHVAELNRLRKEELAQMRAYAAFDGCRMAFLAAALDDESIGDCGICDNCQQLPLPSELDSNAVQRAQRFLSGQFGKIKPRKKVPSGGLIAEVDQLAPGRFLTVWGSEDLGKLVQRGKQEDGYFDDRLVDAMVTMIRDWSPTPATAALTFVPSERHPTLVSDFARRLANALGIPLLDIVSKLRPTAPQKTMSNSYHQYRNVSGAFAVTTSALAPLELGPVLLLDDIVDSGWTMAEIGRLLLQSGFPVVYPVALASSAS